jgi:uncharacterized protein (TIRG00374 family)
LGLRTGDLRHLVAVTIGDERQRVAQSRTTRNVLRWSVAVGVSTLFVVLLVRRAGMRDIADGVARLPLRAMLVAFGWLVLAGWFRAARLRMLLPELPSLGQSYALNQISNLITAAVPAGVGEVASAWVFRRLADVSVERGAIALFVGRALDLAVVVALFLLALASGHVHLGTHAGRPALAATVILLALVAVGWSHVRSPEQLPATLDRFAGKVRADGRVRRVLHVVLRRVSDALRTLPRGRGVLTLLFLTLCTQLAALAALDVLLSAIGVEIGYAGAAAAFLLYALLRMLPVQGVAGVGTHAAWWAISLSLLQVPADAAIAAGAALYVAFMLALVALCATALPLLATGRKELRPA